MNNKAQLGIGAIVLIAIAAIVGLILFQPIADNVEQGTRAATGVIASGANYQITATSGTAVELVGQELVTITSVKNGTSGEAVPTSNYTLAECVKTSNNLKGICYTGVQNGTSKINISYSYYPDGYIDDAGARSVSGIIILLTAMGVAMIVLAGNKFDWW